MYNNKNNKNNNDSSLNGPKPSNSTGKGDPSCLDQAIEALYEERKSNKDTDTQDITIAVVDLSGSTDDIRPRVLQSVGSPDQLVVFACDAKVVDPDDAKKVIMTTSREQDIGYSTDTVGAMLTALEIAIDCDNLCATEGEPTKITLRLITDGACDRTSVQKLQQLSAKFESVHNAITSRGGDLFMEIVVIPCNEYQSDKMQALLTDSRQAETEDVEKLPGIEFMQRIEGHTNTGMQILQHVTYKLWTGNVDMNLGSQKQLFGMDWGNLQDDTETVRELIALFQSVATNASDSAKGEIVLALRKLRELGQIVYNTQNEMLVAYWKQADDNLFNLLTVREKIRFLQKRPETNTKAATTMKDALQSLRTQGARKRNFTQMAAILDEQKVFLTEGAVYLLVAVKDGCLSFVTGNYNALTSCEVDLKSGTVDTGSGVYTVAFQTFFGDQLDITPTEQGDLCRMMWRECIAKVCNEFIEAHVKQTSASVLKLSPDLKWLPLNLLAHGTFVPETRAMLAEVLLWMLEAQEVRDGVACLSIADKIRFGSDVSDETREWMTCGNPAGEDAVKTLVQKGVDAFLQHAFFEHIVQPNNEINVDEDLCFLCLQPLPRNNVYRIMCGDMKTNLFLHTDCKEELLRKGCKHPILSEPIGPEHTQHIETREATVSPQELVERSEENQVSRIIDLFVCAGPGGHLRLSEQVAEQKERVRQQNIQAEAARVEAKKMMTATLVQISNTLCIKAAEARPQDVRTCRGCNKVCRTRGDLFAHLAVNPKCQVSPDDKQAAAFRAALLEERAKREEEFQALLKTIQDALQKNPEQRDALIQNALNAIRVGRQASTNDVRDAKIRAALKAIQAALRQDPEKRKAAIEAVLVKKGVATIQGTQAENQVETIQGTQAEDTCEIAEEEV